MHLWYQGEDNGAHTTGSRSEGPEEQFTSIVEMCPWPLHEMIFANAILSPLFNLLKKKENKMKEEGKKERKGEKRDEDGREEEEGKEREKRMRKSFLGGGLLF